MCTLTGLVYPLDYEHTFEEGAGREDYHRLTRQDESAKRKRKRRTAKR